MEAKPKDEEQSKCVCISSGCPTHLYGGPGSTAITGSFYCNTGKTTTTNVSDGGCNCNTCNVWTNNNLTGGLYCIKGAVGSQSKD